MAVKDIIGPGFVGTATIEYIVTRGLISGAAPIITVPDMPGIEYATTDDRMHYASSDERLHYKAQEPT